MNLNLPPAVENLYRDLRDRRLLPVAGLLVVALIAVPVLLGGGEAPVPSVGEAGEVQPAALEAPEAQPVVRAEDPGIRNYSKRLADFRRKNPFRQQLTGPSKQEQKEAEQADQAEQDAAQAGAEAAGSGSGDAGGDGDGGPAPSDVDPAGPSSEGAGGRLILFSYEIDVKAGLAGEAETMKGVEQGKLLPSKRRPIALFLNGNVAGKQAFFSISSGVSGTFGDGECAPTPESCDFLMLKEGQEQRFRWADGRVYRLKLARVRLVQKPLERGDLSASELHDAQSSFQSVIESLQR